MQISVKADEYNRQTRFITDLTAGLRVRPLVSRLQTMLTVLGARASE